AGPRDAARGSMGHASGDGRDAGADAAISRGACGDRGGGPAGAPNTESARTSAAALVARSAAAGARRGRHALAGAAPAGHLAGVGVEALARFPPELPGHD